MIGSGEKSVDNDAFPEWEAESMLRAEVRTKHYLGRIAAREHQVGAWAWLSPHEAMNTAREIDAHENAGLLRGMILGIKDIFDTCDMPTGLGFEPYQERRPLWDAGSVAACRQQGAVVLGKTVTTEFAYFAAGKTRNPYDVMATPGGSSSGSAAAVADGMVDVAFGSQTAGSLIRPAAYCGVIGYKASHGVFGLSGVRPLAQSFDSFGLLSKNLSNIQAVIRALRGVTETEEPATPRPPTLGFCRTPHWLQMEQTSRHAVEQAVDSLKAYGAEIIEIPSPDDYQSTLDDHELIMAYEVAKNYAFEFYRYNNEISSQFRALCEKGFSISHRAYFAALNRLDQKKLRFSRWTSGFDGWIAPSALGEAPLASEGTGSPVMSLFWTALGAPCVALPCSFGPNHLPLGIQLVNSHGKDKPLLRTAEWIERHLGWRSGRP